MSERYNIIESSRQVLGAWDLGHGVYVLPSSTEGRQRPNYREMSFKEILSMIYDSRGFLVSPQSE